LKPEELEDVSRETIKTLKPEELEDVSRETIKTLKPEELEDVSRETFGILQSSRRWVFFGNAGDGRTLRG
jgi:flagellar motor switch protein FliG